MAVLYRVKYKWDAIDYIALIDSIGCVCSVFARQQFTTETKKVMRVVHADAESKMLYTIRAVNSIASVCSNA